VSSQLMIIAIRSSKTVGDGCGEYIVHCLDVVSRLVLIKREITSRTGDVSASGSPLVRTASESTPHPAS
jgi:hypothetical protein